MNNTAEQRKEFAIEALNTLGIYKPYINAFKAKKQTVTMFEEFIGFYATKPNGFEELENKIREIEAEYNVTVYAVTHERFVFGECYSLLYVPSDTAKDDKGRTYNAPIAEFEEPHKFYALAYVWNVEDDLCSEFGEILVQSCMGGLRRVG